MIPKGTGKFLYPGKKESIGGEPLYRAVIVDDEPFMLEGMRLMIDWPRCGFDLCGEAATAQDALYLLDTLKPHLLITDVQMPGMQGTDLAAIVNRYHPEVMILFFSEYRDFTFAQAAIRAHAFGYLVKPIDAEEVEAALLKVKDELDARKANIAEPLSVLHDQVLRRVALGDDSADSLMRAGVLLSLQRDDPCYCAVLARDHGAVPESAGLVLASAGATVCQLSPSQFGLVYRQVERNLSALNRLLVSLPADAGLRLSVGGVYRGPSGFVRSLREALDAQGLLFESNGRLRLFHPFNEEAAAWLADFSLSSLRAALSDENPDALENALSSLRSAIAEKHPSPFSLRCMAAALDASFPLVASDRRSTPLRPFWRDEMLDQPQQWLEHLCDRLRNMRGAVKLESGDNWPPAVQAAMTTVRTRYADALCIGDVAMELKMNSAYLGQLIHRYTGMTFHRRLLLTRLEHACLLLRQTTRPVGEIAMEVGFRDVDYFSQQFRNRMGLSPVAYRGAAAAGEGADATN